MKEGENEEEVDVNIEIPSKLLQDVLDNSRKRKADDSIDYRNCKVRVSSHDRHYNAGTTLDEDLVGIKGDRKDKLEEYCNWTLQ